MEGNTLTIVVSIVALVIALYSIWKAREAGVSLTPNLIENTLTESTFTATELTEVAITAAKASEQLYRTGKIQRDERLEHAFNYVRKWFPDIDSERILTAVEAGVFVVNSIVEGLPDHNKKAN